MNRFEDLTLVTTAHNNAEMCVAMLKSFEENVGCAAELVVVDDASSAPLSLPVLTAPVRLQRNASSLGFCKASDLAVRAAKTAFALLVDADVLFQKGDFQGGYDEFRRDHWAWVNFRQVSFQGQAQDAYEQPLMPPIVFAAGNQFFSWWQRGQSKPQPAAGRRIAPVEAAHSSSTLINMEAFRAVGGFDPWYWQCQSDVDLSLRLRRAGYKVGVDLGYQVQHEGAGGRTGGSARVMDLYRSRIHLYEHAFPASRFYLRPALFLRHLAEVCWFGLGAVFGRGERLKGRIEMLKGVLHGYH